MSRDGIGGTITGVRAGVKTPFRARNLPEGGDSIARAILRLPGDS